MVLYGGAVASWLVRLSPDQAIRVRALTGDTVPLSTQEDKWVPANYWGTSKSRGVTCDGLASRPGEVGILLAAPCYRNGDKLRQV